ncbi:MAG: (Fe-S)-binding protein [Chloroflexi bacterium]|nr:(Fe-S)-binding protein [Chloroflexota bacterium]
MTTAIDEINKALQRCNRCGFCQAGCPLYKVTGLERTTARGRLAIIGTALAGKLGLDDLEEAAFNCLTCNGCVDHCPPEVITTQVVTRVREELLKRRGQPWQQRFLLHSLLPNPSLQRTMMGLARFSQVSGLRAVLRRSGLLALLPAARRAEALLPPIPRLGTDAGPGKLIVAPPEPEYRVAFFIGCLNANLYPETVAAALRLLARHRVQVTLPDFRCCGLPAYSYGDSESARSLARKNIDAVGHDVDAVVTACASCGSFLKDYRQLLAQDAGYSERAAAFSARVKDITELLAQVQPAPGATALEQRITYHDPCHLARFQKVTQQPRHLLKSVPGLELVEMAEADMCCGGAGSYSLGHYELSLKVLERKMDNVAATGASILVTGCPGCRMQLAYGASRRKLPVAVLDTVELLDRAYSQGKG